MQALPAQMGPPVHHAAREPTKIRQELPAATIVQTASTLAQLVRVCAYPVPQGLLHRIQEVPASLRACVLVDTQTKEQVPAQRVQLGSSKLHWVYILASHVLNQNTAHRLRQHAAIAR